MYDIKNHPVDPAYAKDANMTLEQYQAWYKESLEQPDQFCASVAGRTKDCHVMGHVETSNCSCVSRACASRRQEIRLDVRI